RALVFADPEATLRVNGDPVAVLRQRPGDALATVDLVPHLKAGKNLLVFEAASPDGVGGLLFAAEGDGFDPDAVASGGDWGVTLDRGDGGGGRGRPAVGGGGPPQSPGGCPPAPGTGGR